MDEMGYEDVDRIQGHGRHVRIRKGLSSTLSISEREQVGNYILNDKESWNRMGLDKDL